MIYPIEIGPANRNRALNEDKACDHCGKPDTTYHPRGRHYLCPKCVRLQALSDAAHEHLTDLIRGTLRPWALHWQAAGLSLAELADSVNLTFEVLGGEIVQVHVEAVREILESAAAPGQKED